MENTFLAAMRYFFGYGPKAGPKAGWQKIDFSVANPYPLSLVLAQEEDKFEFIQSLFIDNYGNPAALQIFNNISNQRIVIPPGGQGYLPVLCLKPDFIFTTTGEPVVYIQFLNAPVPAAVWETDIASGGSSSDPAYVLDAGGALINASSGTPASAASLLGTLAARATRALYHVQNQSDEQVQIQLGVAGPVILLEPSGANQAGGAWSDSHYKGVVNVYTTTAGKQVMIYEV